MSISVDKVTKRFTEGGTPAVREVSFSAAPNGITTLLGPSGSGKTTLLRMVAGLEQPDAGRILFQGKDWTQLPVRERNIGMVFQGYALFGHMKVFDNVAFALSIRKAPKAEIQTRVTELLALVQLDGMADRYPSQLSGGQRQRVAFARALANRPALLLLDEPFGALDARVRLELRDWLRVLHEKTHVTTLMVTHDQEEALELSAHVVVMHEGRVVQAGTPQEIYDRPLTPFVASFVGNASVLTGSVKGGVAQVGDLQIHAPLAQEGAQVQAVVRPHDVKLIRANEEATGVALAVLERLTRVGAIFKLSLRLGSGEVMAVQMSAPELEALGIAEGDRVLVDLKAAKVFVEDYAI